MADATREEEAIRGVVERLKGAFSATHSQDEIEAAVAEAHASFTDAPFASSSLCWLNARRGPGSKGTPVEGDPAVRLITVNPSVTRADGTTFEPAGAWGVRCIHPRTTHAIESAESAQATA
ncbi:hypothetical protein AB0I54_11575 [Streptomyces sp. NPDC050625]|uniref:three-helix bundle dimerization domain-containing protein n=1 Tax=Streptomyces sp. NPDC050625 TaxID=3154629 RepID=UPI003419DD5D